MPTSDRVLRALGLRLRQLREARGLTQERLGEKADLDQTYLSGVERYLARLDAEAAYDEEEGVSRFRGGGDCGRCTDSATRIAAEFCGQVWGFFIRENPSAALPCGFAEGHDFSILRGRFLVDWWAHLWAGCAPRAIYDLSCAEDRSLAAPLYGDAACWSCVADFVSRERCSAR